nr:SGNH/GDSL hydrolase family protein [Desulfobaculum xiamenense]
MRYRGHPFTAFEPDPDFVAAGGVRIHNNCSFRDSVDYTREYVDSFDLRVYLAGGSTVYDTCVDDNAQTFAALLQDELTRRTGRRVKVFNAGVGNFTSFQSFTRLAAWADFLRPHVVVVYQGINDITPFLYTDVPPKGVRPDLAHSIRPLCVAEVRDRLPRSARWSGLVRLFAALAVSDEDFNIRFHTLGGSHKVHHIGDDTQFALDHIAQRIDYGIIRSHYENIVALCRFRDIPALFLTERLMEGGEWYRPFLDRINDIVRELDRHEGCHVLDFDRLFPADAENFVDAMHFSARGNESRAGFVGAHLAGLFTAGKEAATCSQD